MNDEAIIAATRKWIEQAVIGLNLCPFAKAVYVSIISKHSTPWGNRDGRHCGISRKPGGNSQLQAPTLSLLALDVGFSSTPPFHTKSV